MQRTSRVGIRSRGGYTLIEVLMVLVVMSALAALAVPRVSGVIARAEFSASARALAANMRRMHQAAVSTAREAVVEFDLTNKTYRVSGGRSEQLPANVAIDVVTADGEVAGDKRGRIRFYPDGSATGGQIKLSCESDHVVIDIDWLFGAVRLYESRS